MIKIGAYHAYIRATLRLTLRDRVVLFFSYLFPIVFFFAFGEGFGAAKSAGNAAQVVTMVLVLGVLGNGFFGGGIRAVVEREMGILRRFKVAPITPAPILVSSVVTGWTIYIPAVILFFVLARVRYGLPLPSNPISLFVLLTLGIVAFRSMGLIIASVVNSMGESQVLVQVLYFPMLLLSGATIPLSTMPEWLQVVAQFLPATHLYLGLQGIVMRGESLWDNLGAAAALAAVSAVCLFISIKLFRWEKEDKLKPAAKLWVAAALAPVLVLGCYQAWSRTNLQKTKLLARQQQRSVTWLIRDARLFIGDGQVVERGAVLIKDGVIAEVYQGHGPEPSAVRAEPLEGAGRTLLPGLLDLWVELPAGSEEEVRQALASQLYCGVTGVVAAANRPEIIGPLIPRLMSGEVLGSEVLGFGPKTPPAGLPAVAVEWASELRGGEKPSLVGRSLTAQVLKGAAPKLGRAASETGVPAMVPYSASGLYGLPQGPALHRQLALMVRAGVPPSQALQAVTGLAARRLGRNMGLIETGREASLVLVDGNPLEDITVTERVVQVFFKGERVPRNRLLDGE